MERDEAQAVRDSSRQAPADRREWLEADLVLKGVPWQQIRVVLDRDAESNEPRA